MAQSPPTEISPTAENRFRAVPKAVLHEHLDGGLRPRTILELAEAEGYAGLPANDPAELAAWFHQGESGSLERYLEAFRHTIAVMQSPTSIERVAYEAVVDLDADGVVYAEIRFAPSQHRRKGLSREEVIEAALAGVRRGVTETGMVVGLIIDAMRQDDDSVEVARAAGRFAGEGVVGFDLAGPEAGNPPSKHAAACRLAMEYGLALTIHAGEGAGPDSIASALIDGRARRIGHGVRVIEDTKVEEGRIRALGDVARVVRDLRIPLEVCITSNLHTGAVADLSSHPLPLLVEAGFNVTLNTDNRLMSGITLSDEYRTASTVLGLTDEELGRATIAALEAGFGDWPTRRALIRETVAPAYGLG